MTTETKLQLTIAALKHIAPMVCFRIVTGEFEEPPVECACFSCIARQTLENIGEDYYYGDGTE